MTQSPPPILISTEGFALRAEVMAHAETKAGKLLRHEHPRVYRVRLHLKCQTPRSGAPYFSGRATAENEGADHIAHAEGETPEAAVNELVTKLERALAASAGARKHRQHHPHATELGTALPKVP